LQSSAARSGFDLQVASGFRSFDRQLMIWNAKARGQRTVHDDHGRPVDLQRLTPLARAEAILRFSALPGASRHHWGTDLDVFDAAALPADYRLQLTPEEVADDGMMGPFHRWLDEELARGGGFFRPYAEDTGGVAVERWHLSYAPLAAACEAALTPVLLADAIRDCDLELADVVLAELPALFDRYVRRNPEANL
jgi:LAS superfamily LD-carboxypeptidase LdcB